MEVGASNLLFLGHKLLCIMHENMNHDLFICGNCIALRPAVPVTMKSFVAQT